MPYSMWIGIDMGLVLIAALLVVYGEVINFIVHLVNQYISNSLCVIAATLCLSVVNKPEKKQSKHSRSA